VLVPAGLLVVPAIFSGGLTWYVHEQMFYALRVRDMVGMFSFVGLSAIFVLVSLRAALRTRRQFDGPRGLGVYQLFAYFTPYLIVPGLFGGVGLALMLGEDIRPMREASADRLCDQVFATPQPACRDAALDCARDIYRQDLNLGYRRIELLEKACLTEWGEVRGLEVAP